MSPSRTQRIPAREAEIRPPELREFRKTRGSGPARLSSVEIVLQSADLKIATLIGLHALSGSNRSC